MRLADYRFKAEGGRACALVFLPQVVKNSFEPAQFFPRRRVFVDLTPVFFRLEFQPILRLTIALQAGAYFAYAM